MILFLQYGFNAFVVKRDQSCEEMCFVPFISNAHGRMCLSVFVQLAKGFRHMLHLSLDLFILYSSLCLYL